MPSQVANPRRYRLDLPALHALCDANYSRLVRLVPVVGDLRRVRVAGDHLPLTVQFEVLERSPYTTAVKVEEVRAERSPWLASMGMHVRLYHDLGNAEVIEYQNQSGFWPRYRYPNPDMRHPDEKLQINVLLAELLQACLDRGEDVPASEPDVPPPELLGLPDKD